MSRLQTLAEWRITNPTVQIFPAEIDAATQEALINWYQYRNVCDNKRFGVFFLRTLALYAGQYNQLLRLETTTWDPMVVEYMERQIKTSSNEATTGGQTNTQTATGNSSNSQTANTTGNSSQKTVGNKDTTEQSRGQTTSTDRGTSSQNTVNGGQDKTVTQDSKTTGGTRTTEGTDTGHREQASTNEGVTGTTPDSSMYPANAGMPNQLNWQFLSGQQEGRGSGTEDSTGTTKRTETSTGEDSGTSNSTTTHGATQQVTGSTTGNGTVDANTSGSGTEDYTETVTGNTGTNQTVTNLGRDDRTTTGETRTDGTRTETGDTRERYSGRHEPPQDLLSRAWSYVLKSNAFQWLLKQTDSCFLAILDYEEDDDYGTCCYL